MSTPNASSSGGANTLDDVPEHVANQGERTEAEAILKYLLGLNTSRDLQDNNERKEFAEQVAARIIDTVRQTRAGLTQAKLGEELDEKINESLTRIRNINTSLEQPKQLSAALNAIYEVAGQPAMQGLVRQLTVPFENAMAGEKEGTVSTDVTFTPAQPIHTILGAAAGAPVRVTIDLTHPFWKGKKFDKPDDLIKAMHTPPRNKLKDLGVKIGSVAENYELAEEDAKQIIATNFQVVRFGKDYGTTANELIGTGPKQWSIDVDFLARQRTTNGATPSQLISVGAMNESELEAALRRDASLWSKVVPSLAAESIAANDGHPSGVTWAAHVAAHAFRHAARTGGTLATENFTLHNVQKETAEREETYNNLKAGARNQIGVDVAMAMISQVPSIIHSTQSKSEAAVRKEKAELLKKKEVHDALQRLKGMPPLQLDYPHVDNLQGLIDEEKKLLADYLAINSPPSPPNWQSKGAATITGQPDMGLLVSPAEKKTAQTQISAARQQVLKDIAEYRKITAAVKFLYDTAAQVSSLSVVTSSLKDFVDPTTGIKNAEFKNDFSAINLIGKIGDFGGNLEPADKLDELIKKKEEEVEKAKKGTLKGDALQHKIFSEYLRAKGITEPEAVANYVSARSYLDGAMEEKMDHFLDDEFEDIEGAGSYKDALHRDVVHAVAKALHVGVSKNDAEQALEPKWGNASYDELCAAYFSLRRMYEGKEGSFFALRKSPYMNKQMKVIARLLGTKHGMRIYADSIAHLSDEEKKKKAEKPAIIAAVKKFLTGEPPSEHAEEIEHVLKHVKTNVQWKRRKVGRFINNIFTNDNGYSARSLLVGKQTLSLRTLANNTLSRTGKIIEPVRSNAKNIAIGVGLGILGGFIAPAIYFGFRHLTKENSSASSHGHGH